MNDAWMRAALGTLWVISAVIVVSGVFVALFHMLQGEHMWCGVPALAVIVAAGCGLLTWRVLFEGGRRL